MTSPQAPQRVFAHRRILRIPMRAYRTGIEVLIDAIRVPAPGATAVIGIANGGTAPAATLGEQLGLPVYQVNARHNPTNALYTQATGVVATDLSPLTMALDGHRLSGTVVLVDDIYGTGATIDALLPGLSSHLEPGARVMSVVLCRNAGAVTDPDLWLWTVDDWVQFPWEPVPPTGVAVEDLDPPSRAVRR